MENKLDNFFLSLPEAEQSVLIYLRKHILNFNANYTEHYKFNTPFYYYKGKWNCYLYYNKKLKQTYIGFMHGYLMNHKKLMTEGRTQIKVYYIDCKKDIDIKTITTLLELSINAADEKMKLKKNAKK